jgi:predicted metalloprotease with PDZ domain
MYRLAFSLLAFLLSVPAFSQKVHYTIEPVFKNKSSFYLHVEMQFTGSINGITNLQLPNQYGGEQYLYRNIRNLKGESPDIRIKREPEKPIAVLSHPFGQEVRVSYDVVQGEQPEGIGMHKALSPQLQQGYFHLLGLHLFLYPRDWTDYSVEIEWKNMPENWLIHNSFGTTANGQTQTLKAVGKRWLESVFVAGDFRLLETEVSGSPIYLAVRGKNWAFSDRDLLQNLKEIVQVQRNFWESDDFPAFTVTLLPLDLTKDMTREGVRFYQYLGVGLTNSFTTFATPTDAMTIKQLRHLFHHEMLHEWVGNRIRCGKSPADMRYAWFSEGFTEYLAYKNMLNAGHISASEFIEAVNKDFAEKLYRSPVGSCSNSLLNQKYFVDPEYKEIAYKRGFMLAFYMDNAIKLRTAHRAGLREFMIELLDYYQAGNFNRNISTHPDFFEEAIDEFMATEMQAFLRRHVDQGQLIEASAYKLPPYLHQRRGTANTPSFLLDTSVSSWETLLKR